VHDGQVEADDQGSELPHPGTRSLHALDLAGDRHLQGRDSQISRNVLKLSRKKFKKYSDVKNLEL
jgi:hypothetical protein